MSTRVVYDASQQEERLRQVVLQASQLLRLIAFMFCELYIFIVFKIVLCHQSDSYYRLLLILRLSTCAIFLISSCLCLVLYVCVLYVCGVLYLSCNCLECD